MPVDPVALAHRWVPGEGVPRIREVDAGLINTVYQVDRDGRRYSLRVGGDSGALDRHWECRVLEAASRAGLGAELVICEPDGGIVVTRWVEGRPLGAREAQRPEALGLLARVIRTVQTLVPGGPIRRISPAEWVAHYGRALDAREGASSGLLEKLARAAASRLAVLDRMPARPFVLCHGDCHRLNLIAVKEPGAAAPDDLRRAPDLEPGDETGGFADPAGAKYCLLDWEYAHFSDPLWDIAGWIANEDLSETQSHALLTQYLGRDPEENERERLSLLTWLFDYVCWQWGRLYATEDRTGRAATERGTVLAARLQGGGPADRDPAH